MNQFGTPTRTFDFRAGPSPFSRILGTGWCDGLTHGIAQGAPDGIEYRFDVIEERRLDDEEGGGDLRVFRLAPMPGGSLDRLEEALRPYTGTHPPIWVPTWRFPTEEARIQLDDLFEKVLAEAGPDEWIVASDDLAGRLVAARPAPPRAGAEISDWFDFLGLPTSQGATGR